MIRPGSALPKAAPEDTSDSLQQIARDRCGAAAAPAPRWRGGRTLRLLWAAGEGGLAGGEVDSFGSSKTLKSYASIELFLIILSFLRINSSILFLISFTVSV